jgi:tetratricopeptide (TPR) repeat protein
MKIIVKVVVWLAVLGAAIAGAQSTPVSGNEFPSSALGAVAGGNWQGGLKACSTNGPQSAVLRAVRGHCLLALNRNDESLVEFLALYQGRARAQWLAWATAFSSQFPQSPIAAYFKGDARARMGDWSGAVAEYNRAIQLRPNFALALNARGLADLELGQDSQAEDDFEAACAAAPDLADAQASLGCYWLQHHAPESAYPCFTNALEHSGGFALAVNGKGCAMFEYGTNQAAAFNYFKRAAVYPEVAGLACQNAAYVLMAEAIILSNTVAGVNAGTTINASDLRQKIQQQIQDISQINQGILQNSRDAGWASAWGQTLDRFGSWAPIAGSVGGPEVAFGSAVAGATFHDIAQNLGSQATYDQSLALQQQQAFQDHIKNDFMAPSFRDHPGSPQALAYQSLYGAGTPGGATTGGIQAPQAGEIQPNVTTWFGLAQTVSKIQNLSSH